MRVVFLGTPEFAVPALETLLASRYEVCAVITQPDRPAGRGHRLQPPPVKTEALKAGLPVYQPEKIRLDANRPPLESFAPDFLVVVAYGQILPGWLLRIPRLGPVNIHGSLLPKYRGAAPVIWALINGDSVTGITTMLMDEHMDTGPVLLRREMPVSDTVTGGELSSRLALLGAELLIPTLDGLADGSITPQPQDDARATLAPRIKKETGEISWGLEARAIHNLVRALNPWPLAYTLFDGQKLQILRSNPEPGEPPEAGPPGTFLGMARDGIRVACGRGGVLEILQVKPESRAAVGGRQFAVGARLQPGRAIFPPRTALEPAS